MIREGGSQGWESTLSIFPSLLFSQFFRIAKNIVYPLNITFIFDRCHRSISCGDTCPIWMEFEGCKGQFKKIKISITKLMKGKNSPHPIPLPHCVATLAVMHHVPVCSPCLCYVNCCIWGNKLLEFNWNVNCKDSFAFPRTYTVNKKLISSHTNFLFRGILDM